MKYIRELDGVRAVAIILVMLFHYYYLLEVGWIGVQLFFVLSGYLITTILLKDKDQEKGFYLKRFYWRRALRIFPLYYAYLGIFFLAFLFYGYPAFFPDLAPFLFSYTYNIYPLVHNFELNPVFTHFWSLSVEEQFYLFWPFVIYHLNRKQLRIALSLVILLSPLVRFLFGEWLFYLNTEHKDIGQIIYRLTLSHIDAFAFGALIPVFKLDKVSTERIGYIIAPFAFFLLLGYFNYTTMNDSKVGPSSLGYPNGSLYNFQHVWSYTVINAASLSFILSVLVLNNRCLVRALFGNSMLVEIGKISYGMYIYHWVILSFIKSYAIQYISNGLVLFLSYFLITFIISWLSYYLFELIFIKMKNKRYNKSLQ